jgi:putative acetyltransferase
LSLAFLRVLVLIPAMAPWRSEIFRVRDKVVEMDQPSEQHERGVDAVSISLAPIVGAEADHLLVLSDEYMASLYRAESNHLVSSESLRTGDAVFLGAFMPSMMSSSHETVEQSVETGVPSPRGESWQCIGCVAARFYREAGYAEIKRLYVQEAHRGLGLSRTLMSAIEAEILAEGIDCARLEMGIFQPEADALYRSIGYHNIPPFGEYLVDPLSQFFEKAPLRAP